jgi:carbon dioxide concentrating mechanism protein CcmN
MIYLPPPQPVLNKDIRISGDVEIHPTASLAPGVILQAAPNSRILIGADVCIGMGAIINACQGTIEIEAGAILGSGVLIIGESKIGSNCCIGTSTTIFQGNVPSMTVVEPGSIIGDASRQVEIETKPESASSHRPTKKSPASQFNGTSSFNSHQTPPEPQPKTSEEPKENSTSASIPHVEATVTPVQKPKVPVVGQVYINELLITLFPHRKNVDSNSNKSPE